MVERMGNKNPNHPIHNRSLLRLLRNLHVTPPLSRFIRTNLLATLPLITSPTFLTTEPVPAKNSPPFSVAHYFPHTSSSSSDFTQRPINVKAVSVPIAP